jgi:hypothetical protein
MHFHTLISTGFHVYPYDGPIPRPEKSYRVCLCVCVCVCVCLTECDHVQDNPLHPQRVSKIGHAKKQTNSLRCFFDRAS